MLANSSSLKDQNDNVMYYSQFHCKKQPEELYQLQELMANQKLAAQIIRVNNQLAEISDLKVGDLNSTLAQEKYKTLSLIRSLIKQVRRLQQSQHRMNSYRKKTDQFLIQKEQLLEKMSKDQKIIQYERQSLLAKKDNMERIYKHSQEKLTVEKEDYLKQLRKIQAREKAYQVQFRKKDNLIKILQDGIRKLQQKSVTPKVSFEVYEKPTTMKKRHVQDQDTKQYSALALSKIQESIKHITNENSVLKQILNFVQTQLNNVFMTVNRKLISQCEYKNNQTSKSLTFLNFNAMKNSQATKRNKMLDDLKQNVGKLKKYIQVKQQNQEQLLQIPILQLPASPKFATVPNNLSLKNLIQNFKEIVKSQDQLLNKMICQKDQFMVENRAQQRCGLALDQYELEKVKDIIEQQMNKIEAQNEQLIKTKSKFNESLKKVEQIKQQVLHERSFLLGMHN